MSDARDFLNAVPEGEGHSDAVAFTRSVYARTKTLSRSGGKLYGNFETDFTFACTSAFSKYFELGQVVAINSAGSCSSGDAMSEIVVR